MLVTELRPGDVIENTVGEIWLVTMVKPPTFEHRHKHTDLQRCMRVHVEFVSLERLCRGRWEPPHDTGMKEMGWKILWTSR